MVIDNPSAPLQQDEKVNWDALTNSLLIERYFNWMYIGQFNLIGVSDAKGVSLCRFFPASPLVIPMDIRSNHLPTNISLSLSLSLDDSIIRA